MATAIAAAAGWIGSLFSGAATAVGAGASAAAIGAGATTIASSVIYGAIAGAVIGGATAAIQGGDIVKGATKGALYGAASGAVMGGLSVAFGGSTGAAGSAVNTPKTGVGAAGMEGESVGLAMDNAMATPLSGQPNLNIPGRYGGGANIGGSGLINNTMNQGAGNPGGNTEVKKSWVESNPTTAVMAGNAISGLATGLLSPDQEKIAKDTAERQAIENQKNRDFEREQAAIAAEAKKVELSLEDLMRPLPSIAKFAEEAPAWLSSERWPNKKGIIGGTANAQN